ncbi:Uncharacterised protein [Mycobacterium tuberculosis]|uniref:Uncharacterized protein n=1 Tax=Mycobacterium tuberculosis TaxID=1773 RepID=A0A916PCI3_MYCTX|nr:Uncharacterised protein [Mycobacterium tuberculosis]
MAEIAEPCPSPIGGGVDGNGHTKLDAFGVAREVGGVGCGPSNHERTQAQPAETVLDHPALELVDCRVAGQDVGTGEG